MDPNAKVKLNAMLTDDVCGSTFCFDELSSVQTK